MNIAVCIKRVPDMETRFRIAPDGKGVDTAGVKWEMADFDGYAVEVALQLVEKAGAGEVTVVSMGPEGTQEVLRKALAMGAHKGVHLVADPIPADPLAIATALAAELKDGGHDLVLFGRMATDSAAGAVGPMTAHLLDRPCVTAISHLDMGDDGGTARRDLEGAVETVTFPLPAVLTIDEGIARARLASLKGIMAAKKKPLEVKPAALGGGTIEVLGLELPKERQAGRIVGEGADAVPELVRLLRTEAKVL